MLRCIQRTVAWIGVGSAHLLLFTALLQAEDAKSRVATLLRISEIRLGTMVSEEICTIVYLDGEYRSERISMRRGYADSVRVTEGRIGDEEHKRLLKILHSPEFIQLESPKGFRRLVDENFQGLYISVPRTGRIQELSYPTKASWKPSERALRPLLEWWQQLRRHSGKSFDIQQPTRCAQPARWGINESNARLIAFL
jgi:hypothetical protein